VSESGWLGTWDAVVAAGGSGAIEEAWLARLERGSGDGEELAEALRRLRAAGKKTLAATLLELAAEEAGVQKAWPARKTFLVEMLRLGIGSGDECRGALEECVRHLWAGSPSLERLLASYSLRNAKKPVETLAALEAWLAHDLGGVFAMAGKGPGRVVELNPQVGVLRLDFAREKKVPVPIDAAAKYLTPLPPGHFLRRRLEEPAALQAEVIGKPAEALEAILESFGAPMTVADIKSALDGVVGEDQWTSWWNKSRKNPRVLGGGSGARIQYRLASDLGAEEELRLQFAHAGLSERLELARRYGGRGGELTAYMAAELLAASGHSAAAELAWEALQLAGRLGTEASVLEAAEDALIERFGPLAILDALTDVTQRELVLELVRRDLPARFVETAAAWLEREVHPRVLGRLVADLVGAGEQRRAQAFLDQVFLHPQRWPAAFVWACEEEAEALAPLLDERRGGALLVRLVELAERREMGPFRARLKVVLSARGAAGRILQDRLTVEQARRLQQIAEKPGELGEERAWLRRALAARFAELREEKKDESLPALATTVSRLQTELKKVLEKDIPEVLKAIQIAREHGDLSENFEYHAARARQEFLSARAATLQADLARIKIVDPGRIDPSRVRVGTRVELTGESGRRQVTILGPYEADADAGIVSHESELAQALLDRAVGDQIAVAGVAYTIAAIARVATPGQRP
jgi:transcription elongation factor GreA